MERSDTPALEKNQKILSGISVEHMDSYEVECMTKSIPIQVTYVDSHTRRGKSSRVSAVIPLGHADPLGLALAHTSARRILRDPRLSSKVGTLF